MVKLKHRLSLRLNIVNLCVTLRLVVCINNAVPSDGRRSVSTVLSHLAHRVKQDIRLAHER